LRHFDGTMQVENEEVGEAENNSGNVAQDMMEMDIIDEIISTVVCAIVLTPPTKSPKRASKRAKPPPPHMMTIPELGNHLLEKQISEMETMLFELSKKTRMDFVRLKMLKRARGVDNEPFLRDVQNRVSAIEEEARRLEEEQKAWEKEQKQAQGQGQKKKAPKKRSRKGW